MTVFLGTLWSSIKQIKVPYMFDWEHEIVLHAMQGNRASFQVELGYTKLFHIPAVMSVSFKTCEVFLGDSL